MKKLNWVAVRLGVAIAGMYLAWLATSTYGAGVSTDSINYLSCADHFAAGKGMFDYQNKPLLLWPPLYPFLLGIVKVLTGLSALSIGRWLNIIFFGTVIWISEDIFAENFSNRPAWVLWGSLTVSSSVSILALSGNIGTDTLFVLLVLLFLWVAQRWLVEPKLSLLFSLAGVTAAAAILRWTGAALILIGALVILLGLRRQPFQAFLNAFRFSCISALPLLAWTFGRNYLNYGTLVGGRNLGQILPLENLRYTIQKIAVWFFPNLLLENAWFALLVVPLICALWFFRQPAQRSTLLARLGQTRLIPVWVYLIVYIAYIALTTFTGDHLDYFDDRYQAPLLVPLLILLLTMLDAVSSDNSSTLRRRWIYFGLTVLMFAWLIYPVYQVYKFVRMSVDQGVVYYNQYNNRRYLESTMVHKLRGVKFDENKLPIYSNLGAAVYFFTGHETKLSLQDPENYNASTQWLLKNVQSWPPEEQAYFIWFKTNDRRRYFSPNQIKKVSNLVTIFYDVSGAGYIISPQRR